MSRIAVISLLPVLLTGIVPAAASADDFAIPAPATEVVAYLQGLEVTRRAQVDLPAGAHRILVPAMPNAAGTPRIEVAGATLASSATVTGGMADGRTLFTPAQGAAYAAWRTALDDADRAVDARDRARAAVRSAEDALAFLRSVKGDGLGTLDPAAIGATAGAISGGVTAAEIARADAAAALRAAEDAAAAAERIAAQAERDFDATGGNLGPVTLTALSVDASEAGPVQVTLHDFSPSNGWTLAYDIDLGADDAVTLVRRATISQNTGLPLDGVALRLSTADLGGQTAPTEVRPDLARAEEEPLPLPVPAPQARTLESADVAGIAGYAPLEARADTGGPVVAYDVPFPVDIPVAGDPVTLSLGEARLAARVFNRAAPRTDTTAFRVAEVTNDTDEPLLAGPAILSREGQATGETFLSLLPAGDVADLSFGPVEHLRLDYGALDNETGDRGIFTTSGTRRQDLVFRVRNLSDAPETVETLFALPYSEQEDLQVRITTDPDPDLRDVDERRGVAQWNLTVPARGEAEVRIGVDMEWPEGQTLYWEP